MEADGMLPKLNFVEWKLTGCFQIKFCLMEADRMLPNLNLVELKLTGCFQN